jgi:hypothetical protein
VPHLLGDGRHRQDFVMIERREQEKLREGNIARRQFLGEMKNETALHLEDDVRQPLGIGSKLVVSVKAHLAGCIQTA